VPKWQEFGIQAHQERESLELYEGVFPFLAKSGGPALRRAVILEDLEIQETYGRFLRRSQSEVALGAALVDAARLAIHMGKRGLQNAVLQELEELEVITSECIQRNVQSSPRWDGRDFFGFVEWTNQYHNRKSKEHRRFLKKAKKKASELARLFSEVKRTSGSTDQLGRELLAAIDEAPLPKHLPAPPLVVSEAVWPILKDHGFSIRDGAKLLASACVSGVPKSPDEVATMCEPFRQAILKVNRRLR